MCSAHSLIAFNICVKFHENMSSSLKSNGADTNCEHTKGNNSKRRKTRVTVLVFCTSSYGVLSLCEVS